MSDKSARATQYAQAIVQAMLERWQAALAQAAAALSQDRTAEVDALLPANAPAELVNALKLMHQQGDLDLLKDVSAALTQTVSGRAAPTKAEVVSASELTAEEQAQLRRTLVAQHGEGLVFSFRVDPSLLGGLRVRVGDRLIDNSVASRLTALRESLTAVVR
jgi:F-type H+-transporting ATPase subunit delta